MIAIVASALLGLYIFLPSVLFSRFTSQFVELKKDQRNQFEEIVAGITVSAIPLFLAWSFSHLFWFPGHWPYPINGPSAEKFSDYRVVLSAIYSESFFQSNQRIFWQAAEHIWHHQLRFALWNYIFLIVEIIVVNQATKRFGDWHKNSVYRFLFGDLVLRRSSQWYVLFRAFMFPRHRKPKVMLDILTTDKHLYDGEIADYFVSSSGNLSEILLKGFRRFRKAEFEDARKIARAEGTANPNSDNYWTVIPGANFLIPYDKIANINIRYVFANDTLASGAQNLLRELSLPDVKVTVRFVTSEQDKVSPSERPTDENGSRTPGTSTK
jgi:hypothetical protein